MHINTAYFAGSPELDLIWLSDPDAKHSRNLLAHPGAAIAVYDSTQEWGEPDRGIQLIGSARGVAGPVAEEAERLYTKRSSPRPKRTLAPTASTGFDHAG